MEANERELLISRRVELVGEINPGDGLFTQLISRHILSPRMVRTIQSGKSIDQQTEALLDLLPTRGPDAFRHFCDSLEADYQGHIVRLYLQTTKDPSSMVSSPPQEKEEAAVHTLRDTSGGATESESAEEMLLSSNILSNSKQRLENTDNCGNRRAGQAENDQKRKKEEKSNNDERRIEQPDEEKRVKLNECTHMSDDEGVDLTDGEIGVKVDPCTLQFYWKHRDLAYRMLSSPRGQAIIINVRNVAGKATRRGTDIDRDNMADLLRQLDLVVTVYNDEDHLTAQAMLTKLRDFASSRDHVEADLCVVVILSHGEKDQIYGTDGETIPVDSVLAAFDNNHCPALIGRPKIVFLQACRGAALDSGVPACDEPDSGGPPTRLPSLSDMLVCYPTQQGFYAWRNRERGSWYVEAIVSVFMKYASSEDVCAMLNRVNDVVSRKVSRSPDLRLHNMSQMSEFKSSLRRPYLYLFPGISQSQLTEASVSAVT